MKILLVSLFLPQEKAYHAGGRYVFGVLKKLAEKHEIYLATRLEENELPCLESLRPLCKEIYSYTYKSKEKRNILDILKLAFNYIGFSSYADRIARRGGFDMIRVEWVEAALMMRKRKIPMVLDAHDVITKPAERVMGQSKGSLRFLLYLKYLLVRVVELGIMRRFAGICVRSENDKNYLLSIAPGLKIEVTPHPAGLDITNRIFEKEKNTILFLASFKFRKANVDYALYFYREIFPLVRKDVPDARFIIAGYGPPEELISLRRNDSNVLVTGFVEDIDECYKKASVFVAPILIGGGMITKILDAMAAGTPVVTTSYGNEGIEAISGRDLLVADNPESFAEAVIRLLKDIRYATEIAEQGRAFIHARYNPDDVMRKIESIHHGIA